MINVGDKVVAVNPGYEGIIFTVDNITDSVKGKAYIVKDEENTLFKFLEDDIEVIVENETDTITISREDLKKEINEVINSLSTTNLDLFTVTALTLTASLITNKLEKRLFGEDA